MSEIIRAGAFQGFRPLVDELGGDADALLRAAGIDADTLQDTDAYVPVRKFAVALELGAQALDCRDFGLRIAAYVSADMLGPLALAMMHSETVREGVQLAARYMHFHNTSMDLRLREFAEPDCDFLGVHLHMRRPPRGVQYVERIVAGSNKLLAFPCGAAYRPKEIWLQHQPFAPLAAYRQAFGLTPTFGAPENGILVSRALLDLNRADANPQVKRVAEYFLENAGGPEAGAMAPRARGIVERLMRSGDCTQAGLAQAIGLHERTLQRRLKEENVTFEAIKDAVRRDLAHSYLSQKSVPLSQIGEMLGYAEASAFTRACRRWFGKAPRDVRRELAA